MNSDAFLMDTYKKLPVTFVRGSGAELWDTTGKRYLDFLAGLAVTSLGHCHPAVTDAIARQSRELMHVSNLYGNELAGNVADELDALLSAGHGQVFFANSGAEANECALKLARLWGGPGRHVVLSALSSFHGRTLATLHATGQPEKHKKFDPLPEGFRHAIFNDLESFEANLDDSVAAILIEPVQGEGGVNPATPEFFAGLRRLCDARDMLLIVDEVQTGLGRTGRWFGYQHFGVQPDVVTLAKSLGNGFPVGACWARKQVAAVFEPGDHGSTFGGQPLAMAAVAAVLATMRDESVPERAARTSDRIRQRLENAPGVRGVRGLGLLLGIAVDPRSAQSVAERALDKGLIVNPVNADTIRIAPPLLLTDAQADEGCELLLASI